MIEHSLKSKTKKVSVGNVQVVYNLIFKNAFYSFECYIENSDKTKDNFHTENNYSYIENITDDEGEAELFLTQMVKGKVHPIHIKDMAKDYFENLR
jgi:hypothetical protein